LPTFLVDGRDCCRRKVEVVGQKCKRSLAFLVRDFFAFCKEVLLDETAEITSPVRKLRAES
jgi:hypothetical protein